MEICSSKYKLNYHVITHLQCKLPKMHNLHFLWLRIRTDIQKMPTYMNLYLTMYNMHPNMHYYVKVHKHVLVQYSNGLKEIGCQILLYLNTIWITDSSTIWIPDKLTLSFFLMYWSNIQMVGLVHVHSTIWIPNHLKSEFLKVWYSNGRYSDPHCIWILSKWIFQCLF